ncbi:hypothetical protein GcC1_01111 [Golovinomyces cichoracearum]|uniref:Uncharacterized protein n=1 Tax=Golovinomyces cichoracearum TaxID=62708 RepID=A0A420HZA7_9PEZI|nr:hypothetical protein GcC1_01111 [Golovinomyces cichoracearum]
MASRGLFRPRSFFIVGFCGCSALFLGLKWRAVMERSESAKRSSSKEANFIVVPSRSGGGI